MIFRKLRTVAACLALVAHASAIWAQGLPGAQGAAPAAPDAAAGKPAAPSAPKSPADYKLPPVDEGGKDPTWVAFRTSLLAALQRGDVNALINAVDRNIVNGLEAPRGVAEFRKLWEIDARNSRLMRELSTALNLGSAWHLQDKKTRVLCAPYVPIKWPLDEIDPYESGAIVVKEALIKGRPSHAAETLGALSFDIVPVRDWDVADAESQLKQRWVKINHRGREGYVPEEHIRSAIEHRACFAKNGNTWRMVEYVVGIEFLGGD